MNNPNRPPWEGAAERTERKEIAERTERKEIAERTERRRERNTSVARWAYVILAAFNTLLFVLMGIFVVKYVSSSNHAWCEIIHASLPANPPVLPPNPTANQVKEYNDYEIVMRLGHRFGCL